MYFGIELTHATYAGSVCASFFRMVQRSQQTVVSCAELVNRRWCSVGFVANCLILCGQKDTSYPSDVTSCCTPDPLEPYFECDQTGSLSSEQVAMCSRPTSSRARGH
jgi:hypothetical protein